MITVTATLLVAAPATAQQKTPDPLGGLGPAVYDSSCGVAYRAVRFYRTKYDQFRRELGYRLAPRIEQAMECGRLKQRLRYWRTAAKINRIAAQGERGQVRTLASLSYRQLNRAANRAIRSGHVYSHAWGAASPWLKSLCYEMLERAFRPFGTDRWAAFIVNRESGCNPAAINSSSGTTGIAQFHPPSHPQFDYWRIQHDMRYAIAAFVRLSHGGRYVTPWRCC